MVSKSPKAARRPHNLAPKSQSPRSKPASTDRAHAGRSRQTQPDPATSGVDRWFEITRRGSTYRREIIGGLVTFFAMAYILALNPLIIGTVADANGRLLGGFDAIDPLNPEQAAITQSTAMVAAATALVAGVITIVMGVVGRFPIALATGLGLNAVVAYTVAQQFSWPQAMALVVWEGVLILILVLTGFRTAVFRAVPRSLRAAITVGIGLFVALIGLVNAGVIRPGIPLVSFGVNGSLMGLPILVFVVGLVLAIVLHVRKVRGGLLFSILGATALAMVLEFAFKIGRFVPPSADSAGNPTGWKLNVPSFEGVLALPNLGLLGQVDLFGAFLDPAVVLTAIVLVFVLMLADFFDTMGTVVAVGSAGNLLDEQGNPPHLTSILLVDSIGAAAGGLGSVSSNTAYVESTAGVADGARTGLASVVTGLAFLAAMFFAPLINLVPSEAASPVLVLVGFMMMSQITAISWDDPEEAIPAFLCLALMPFTYSITIGIGAGFLAWILLKVVHGKTNKIHPLLWVVGLAFVAYFTQGLILGAS